MNARFLPGYEVTYATSLTTDRQRFFWGMPGVAYADEALAAAHLHAIARCERIGGYGPVRLEDIRLHSVVVAYDEIIIEEETK